MTSIGHRVDVSFNESSPRTDENGFDTPFPFESGMETSEKICYLVKVLQSGMEDNEYFKVTKITSFTQEPSFPTKPGYSTMITFQIHLDLSKLRLSDFIETIAAKLNINITDIQKLRLEFESKKIILISDEDFQHLPEGSAFDITLNPYCNFTLPCLEVQKTENIV